MFICVRVRQCVWVRVRQCVGGWVRVRECACGWVRVRVSGGSSSERVQGCHVHLCACA